MPKVAKKTSVPVEILWAVAQTESGFNGAPWPWSINFRGKGYYFTNKTKVIAFLKSTPKHLRAYTDLGCMQLNFRYHGYKFRNIYEMLDIEKNMYIAARYLRELYKREKLYRLKHKKPVNEKIIWSYAIGDYHSRRNKPGYRYTAKVAKHLPKNMRWKPSPLQIAIPKQDIYNNQAASEIEEFETTRW